MSEFKPILPLKENIILPFETSLLLVGREFSISAVNFAKESNREIVLVYQKNNMEDISSISEIGTLAQILEFNETMNTIKIKVLGIKKVKLEKINFDNFFSSMVSEYNKTYNHDEFIILKRILLETIEKTKNKVEGLVFSTNLANELKNINDEDEFTNKAANIFLLSLKEKETALQNSNTETLEMIIEKIQEKLNFFLLEEKIEHKLRQKIEKRQIDFILKEKIEIMKEELDGKSHDNLEELAKDLPEEAKKVFNDEYKKLNMLQSNSLEYFVIKNYIDWILSLPWKKYVSINKDIKLASEILDKSHFGLEETKEQILRTMAVNNRKVENFPEPILLVGPPGVGKTSICKSIASAMNCPITRIQMAGVSDPNHFSGHRRTYVGAMPGAFIQAMKKNNAKNSIIHIDEIDKVNKDSMSRDPIQILVALLDSEQNKDFIDIFLEIGFDFSNTMFILTANSISGIIHPLLDRVKIIEVPGYSLKEKKIIAPRLFKQRIEEKGLNEKEISITEGALEKIITDFTMESGLRELKRKIDGICEKTVLEIDRGIIKNQKINEKNLEKILEIPPLEKKKIIQKPGVCYGLAYSGAGGEVVPIEVIMFPGKGDFLITGNLGKVMEESVKIGFSIIKSMKIIEEEVLKKNDFHIHFPAGATPKDGPSAGMAITCAIYSLLTGKISKNIAMTGEIDLSGQICPIGGVKEKINAAIRYNFESIILPESNNDKVIKEFQNELKIIKVKNISETIDLIFK